MAEEVTEAAVATGNTAMRAKGSLRGAFCVKI